jgi:HPr kinase/phosphorylase
MDDSAYHHATVVAIGEAGLLIRGESGSGKSLLAAALIEAATRRGLFARLVGDDRVALVARAGRLVARPHPVIVGRIECRGIGLRETGHLDCIVLRGLIDLGKEAQRLPDPASGTAVIAGLALPRLALPGDGGSAILAPAVLDWLGDNLAIAKELG